MSYSFWMRSLILLGCLSPFYLQASSLEQFEKLSHSPEIYVCDHFLSDEECDHLIKLAQPSLARSTVVDPNSVEGLVDARRTSTGMFLPYGCKDGVVLRMHKRIAEVTGIPEVNGECMQVLHYDVGAEYQPHYDSFDRSIPGGLIHFNRGGQRVATFMVYLNTPEAGGETIFPLDNLKIVPKKGKAVLFYNVTSSGAVDPMSFHGGAPVLKGEKWLITRWLREREFH